MKLKWDINFTALAIKLGGEWGIEKENGGALGSRRC